MQLLPFLFLVTAWSLVLGVTAWSYARLLRSDREEKLPPPGTSL